MRPPGLPYVPAQERIRRLLLRVADLDETTPECECDEGRYVPHAGEHALYCEAQRLLRLMRAEPEKT